MVTVVSPPERMTQGFVKGSPRSATDRASAACTLPTSRDSPSISSLRMWASMPLARAAAEYVPEIQPEDFISGFAGVRAQALGRDGKLVDDFVISETEHALHVRNAPSPAATSSLALARLIADRAEPGLE